jgi:hypothetical protein
MLPAFLAAPSPGASLQVAPGLIPRQQRLDGRRSENLRGALP